MGLNHLYFEVLVCNKLQ